MPAWNVLFWILLTGINLNKKEEKEEEEKKESLQNQYPCFSDDEVDFFPMQWR